jgi:hypothetical protein
VNSSDLGPAMALDGARTKAREEAVSSVVRAAERVALQFERMSGSEGPDRLTLHEAKLRSIEWRMFAAALREQLR